MSVEILDARNPELPGAEFIFGSTPEMQVLRGKVQAALEDDLPVLIAGESGTGKEVIAHFLHEQSGRRRGPFVKVNCGAVPSRVLEREMFVHDPSRLAHVPKRKIGSIGLASGGLLFLDEIGEMELQLQRKLAPILQTGQYRNEEGSEVLSASARFVCSSSLSVEQAHGGCWVSAELLGCFRHVLKLPPLRERKADIPQICEYLAQKFARNFGRPVPKLSESVLAAFDQWNWPGNIRELENWIARIVIFGMEGAIGLEFRRELGLWVEQPPRSHRATHVNTGRVGRGRRHG